MKHKNRAKILHPSTQTNTNFSHAHIGITLGLIVPNNTESASETGKDDVDISIRKNRITGRIIELCLGVRF